MIPRRARRAVTLIELLVVLAIMGIVALTVALAAPPASHGAASPDPISHARAEALRLGAPVRFTLTEDSVRAGVAFPDGSVFVAGVPALDPRTGSLSPEDPHAR